MEQKNTAEARARLGKMVQEFHCLESPEDMLKKAAGYDKAAGVNDPELTRRLLEDMLRPEPTSSLRKQNVIQTTIESYDTKARAKRLLLVAGTTDNNEYVCFNITSAKQGKDNDQYYSNVPIRHTKENHLRYDSYVKCGAEYIIATDSIYSDLRKTPIRIGGRRLCPRHGTIPSDAPLFVCLYLLSLRQRGHNDVDITVGQIADRLHISPRAVS